MDAVNYLKKKICKRNFKNYIIEGRPRARTQIVPPQYVLDNGAINTEKWTLCGLGNFVSPDNSDIHTQNIENM